MNCDQVFEILTRGPFPHGSADDELVEQHLQHCADCRELADAFRPAVNLFHESMREFEELPCYQGRFSRGACSPIPMSVDRVQQPAAMRTSDTEPSSGHKLWTVAACLALIIASVLIGRQQGERSLLAPQRAEFRGQLAGAAVAPSGMTPSGMDIRALAALSIPAECFEPPAGRPSGYVVCCTECHAARGTGDSADATLSRDFLRSCSICHLAQR